MRQGFIASGDAYTRRYDELIKHVDRKVKIVDDTLLYSDDIEQNFWDTWNYISLCANNGIIFNKDKFQFCQDTVDFAGLRINSTNVAPSKSIMSAIENFPLPSDLTSARSWFGLVNQVARTYSISPIMQPFRELIKPHNKFFWDDTLNELFELSKKEILSKVKEGVRSFNPNIRTCIQTDWCKHGIGYLLLQKHCTCPSIDNVICCKDGIYIIIVDRYSGWPCVYYFKDNNANSNNLIHICRELFSSYGVPEEINTDGGPQFTSHRFKLFLQTWDIHHRLSSAEYPQSNGRAEVGVKTAKRIIRDNISNDGSMNNDKIVSAFLQYKNTPLPDINLSPTQILFHRKLKDNIPSIHSHYHLNKEWIVAARERENLFAKKTEPLKFITTGIRDY